MELIDRMDHHWLGSWLPPTSPPPPVQQGSTTTTAARGCERGFSFSVFSSPRQIVITFQRHAGTDLASRNKI
ncbi:hypothetical protein AOLI_G00294790 [Acnodon oligacanthus]